MEEEPEGSTPRAKRQKLDKSGRFAALRKLKDLKQKGEKYKCDIDEIDNVYETIDEEEYTKRVRDRQYDDWIVDEGNHGYIEDGREIFDDDLDSESIALAAGKQKGGKKKKKVLSENAGKGNIQYLLSNIQPKKKEDIKLGEDDALSELILELNETNDNSIKSNEPEANTSVLTQKFAEKSYVKQFSLPTPKLKISKSLNKSIKNERIKQETITQTAELVSQEEDAEMEVSIFNSADFQTYEMEDDEKKENETQKCERVNNSNLLDDEYDMSQLDVDENDSPDENQATETITEDKLVNGWETMSEGFTNNVFTDVQVDISDIPMITESDGRKVFRFYWWDAYENKAAQPGVVLLFGKTYCESKKSYISCCVAVRNIDRQIYLLPRTHNLKTKKPTALIDLYHEFNNNFAKRHNIDTFKSRKITKKYAFDSNIPTESEYLEIRYSAKFPPLEADDSGNTYSQVFGINSNFLEILLLERKIKGPCWLDITNPEPVNNPISWCKLEINCLKSSDISITNTTNTISPPPLTVLAINTKSVINPKLMKNEIVMISCLVHNNYSVDKPTPNPPFQQHFCVMRPAANQVLPTDFHQSLSSYKATRVQKTDSEKAMYNYFLAQFSKIDPDLIVAHDLHGYQLNLFCDRLMSSQVKDISKFGKVKKYYSPGSNDLKKTVFVGRLICDLKISLKELIKSRSYDLDALCNIVLKLKDGERIDIEPEDVLKMYYNAGDILKLISLTMQDTAFILKMMYELNVIPLALQITNIAGNVMSRTLMGGRSERNEFLLLHAFYEKDHIVPDKRNKFKEKNASAGDVPKKGATYSGGLVLDPKVGYYDQMILLMDFNSLYPSIIQEYNICFTTISDNSVEIPEQNQPAGILPTEIRKLVESRRAVKKLMNNPDISNDLRSQYNIRQMALKLTANSMYGCLGFYNSRFYAKHLAEIVTQKGREILTNTKDLVEKMSYEVIYGDTDSIMINTKSIDYDLVFKIGHKIKQEINKLYKQIELDIDGVFKYLLLLKKKKYAAVTLSKAKNGELISLHEYKGLDFVRRDWCSLTAEAGKFILNHILSDLNHDEKIEIIKAHLETLKNDLENNTVPLSYLIVTKQLTKDPKKYNDVQSLPHVQVALKYNQKNGKQLQSGDTVPYVICDDGSNLSATQRAYHVDEYKKNNLKLDVKYYLAQQIHPVVARLCEPIEGIDAYEIAICLGLDANAFKKPKPSNTDTEDNVQAPEVKFRNVDGFVFTCFSCKTKNVIKDINIPFLLKCFNTKCDVPPINYLPSIQNELVIFIRSYISKYYKSKYICEDPSCTYETLRMPMKLIKGSPICESCTDNIMFKTYTARDLYTQLEFLQYIFDLNFVEKASSLEENIINAYSTLKKLVDNFINHSAYGVVNLQDIYRKLTNCSIAEDTINEISENTEMEENL